MSLPRPIILLAAFSLGVVMAPDLQAQPYERVVRDTMALSPGSVSVENEDGSITVSTWARDSVAYRARIVSEAAQAPVDQTRIEADRFAETISLETNYDQVEGRWSFGPKIYGYGTTHPEVHYTLVVPETAELSIDDHSSDVEIRGLRAALEVDTHEGELIVQNHRGSARIESHEGKLSLSDLEGDLYVDTHEGRLTLSNLRGPLALNTHEGVAEVTLAVAERVDVDTHEGAVSLTMPEGAGFDLAADLGADARLDGTFDLTELQNEDGDYHGAVQGGGPLVHITSHEGQVTLRRP